MLPNLAADHYYPYTLGARQATRCPLHEVAAAGMPALYDCSNVDRNVLLHVCADGSTFGSDETSCALTVLDH